MAMFGYVIYGLGLLMAIIWMVGIRTYTMEGRGVQMGTVNATLLFIVSLVLIPLLKISPLHLLWMYPTAYVFGLLSLSFPFSLLSLPGHALFVVVCLGLDRNAIMKNRERIRRGVELVRRDGLTVEEAKKQLEKEGL